MTAFYGATLVAQQSINRLLKLPASGREQDWEVELADPGRMADMVHVLRTASLDPDERCALALLLIATVEEASSERSLRTEDVSAVREAVQFHPDVLDAMRFYWITLGRASEPEAATAVLG